MFRVRHFLAGVVFCLVALCSGHAQDRGNSVAAPGRISLADSVLPLNGPWAFSPGDSPLIDGKPVWAQPGFDDAGWRRLSLPSSAQFRESLPGWMGQGFPQLTGGYAWYRLRVRVSGAGETLWLKMPNAYDDAFQLYANGQPIGEAGFRNGHPAAFYSLPHSYALPSPDPAGTLTIALRFWLDPNTRFDEPLAGGLHRAPMIGLQSTIKAMQARDLAAMTLFYVASEGFIPLFFLIAALASFWAWLKLRAQTEYLWLTLRLLVNVSGALVLDLAYAGKISSTAAAVLTGVVLRSVLTPGWIVFWWHWFQLRRDRWILRCAWGLAMLDALSALCARATSHGELPAHWAVWLEPTNTGIKCGELLLLAAILSTVFAATARKRCWLCFRWPSTRSTCSTDSIWIHASAGPRQY